MRLQHAALQLLNSRPVAPEVSERICERWEIVETQNGYILRDEAVTLNNGEWIHQEDASCCEHCEEWVYNSEVAEVRHVRRGNTIRLYWCDECISGHAYSCANCDTQLTEDAVFEGPNDGQNYCGECLPEPESDDDEDEQSGGCVPSYHHGHRPAFPQELLERPCYSVELEVESANRAALLSELEKHQRESAPWLGWERDGSLSESKGLELLISMRPSVSQAIQDISNLLPILRKTGCTSWDNQRCGIHVNSNTRHWHKLRKARLLYLVHHFRPALEQISGRAGTHWCAWPVASNHREYRRGMEISHLLSNWSNQGLGKYLCVRVGPDRMEWRMFRGTLSIRRISLYLNVVQLFEDASERPVHSLEARHNLRLELRATCRMLGFNSFSI